MQLIRAKPPIYEDIARVFDVRGKPILFAWGDVIYAPVGVTEVAPHLQAHERVHGQRQMVMGVNKWWEKYLSDPEFRLAEEELGHIAEYRHLIDHSGAGRAQRRRHLSHVASRLSAALYRYKITNKEARRVLEDGYARDQGRI